MVEPNLRGLPVLYRPGSPSSVFDRWQAGDLPGYRLFGKKGGPVRFRLAEIEAALEAWHVNTRDK
jgi:hypothetical protein